MNTLTRRGSPTKLRETANEEQHAICRRYYQLQLHGYLGRPADHEQHATAFRTRTPFLSPGDDPILIGTTVELPKAIKSTIKNGLDKVGADCIRGNAEILFGWDGTRFEE